MVAQQRERERDEMNEVVRLLRCVHLNMGSRMGEVRVIWGGYGEWAEMSWVGVSDGGGRVYGFPHALTSTLLVTFLLHMSASGAT